MQMQGNRLTSRIVGVGLDALGLPGKGGALENADYE